jgi:hypothetical protein
MSLNKRDFLIWKERGRVKRERKRRASGQAGRSSSRYI